MPTRRSLARLAGDAATLSLALAAAAVAPSALGRQVHLYTFSDTLPHPGVCALAESTAELGGVLRVIGLGKRPGYILIYSHSPTLKFLMLQEVVEYEMSLGRIKGDDLMIFADGHDTFLQRPLVDLVAAYDRFPGSPYLISGEKNCWPWPHSHESHGKWDPGMAIDPNATFQVHKWLQLSAIEFCRAIPDKGPYRYPNIGLSMGPVSRTLEVLKRNNRIVLDEDVNDQGAMWLVIVRHAEELNIEIDQRGEVFLNMLQYEPGELEREPCVDDYFAPPLHGSGSGGPAGEAGLAVTSTERQVYCAMGTDITDEALCSAAAASLGLVWAGSFRGRGDHRYCLHADDGRNAVFFNSAVMAAAAAEPPNPLYRSICKQASAASFRTNAPPRNVLTGALASMVHFNGPSHEDERWPQCFHAWTKEFRVVSKGHVLFDVDHNVYLDTDFLCDYGFHHIHDFHAHPLHQEMVEFLKDFYQLPMDPGLVAWRGNVSSLDAAKLGREEDLLSTSPRLRSALESAKKEL